MGLTASILSMSAARSASSFTYHVVIWVLVAGVICSVISEIAPSTPTPPHRPRASSLPLGLWRTVPLASTHVMLVVQSHWGRRVYACVCVCV